MKEEEEVNDSEEDRLPVSLAKSIPRDLRGRAYKTPPRRRRGQGMAAEHFSEGRVPPAPLVVLDTPLTMVIDEDGSITVILDTGEVIRCDDWGELEANEIIHCNMALEQNGNNGWGVQGGQGWTTARPSKGPTGKPTARPSEGPTGEPTERPSEGPTREPTVDTRAPSSRPTSWPTIARYDADGNPHPNGAYDRYGNLIGTAPPSEGPTMRPTAAPTGEPTDGTGAPSREPTSWPVIGAGAPLKIPTASPVTAPPSASPITASPTTSPTTESPTASPTTESPTATPITESPSVAPSTASPTASLAPSVPGAPSQHPTLRGDPWKLRGTVYYDHNANGRRDSNVDTSDFGNDAEYQYGLGGVTIQLFECDPETNEGAAAAMTARAAAATEEDNDHVSTVSMGVDVLMHPKLVGRDANGGNYDLIDIKIDRSYYIYATAPNGYIFTGGVCNDDVRGWECRYGADALLDEEEDHSDELGKMIAEAMNGDAENSGDGKRRRLDTVTAYTRESYSPPDYVPPTAEELELGVRAGRSERCVTVDRRGLPDSRLDLGAMRLGDISFGDTEVEMSMDLIDDPSSTARGRILQTSGDDDGELAFFLLQEDKEAIGVVTAEVLAANLDKTLVEKGAVLDYVVPLDVVYLAPEPEEAENVSDATDAAVAGGAENSTAPADANSTTLVREEVAAAAERKPRPKKIRGGKLTVSVKVHGHYNKNNRNDLRNFDHVVQDSINSDAGAIREHLTTYNEKCLDQTSKVADLGYTAGDFKEIHSNRGVDVPKSDSSRRVLQRQGQEPEPSAPLLVVEEQAFSQACDRQLELPEFFETSLGVLKVKAKTRTYVVEEQDGAPWEIVGIIIGVAFALCLFFYLFRRGLKRNSTDKGGSLKKTKRVAFYDDGVKFHGLGNEKMREYDEDIIAAELSSTLDIQNGNADSTYPSTAKPTKRSKLLRKVGKSTRREISNMTMTLTNGRYGAGGDTGARTNTKITRHDSSQPSIGDLEARLQNMPSRQSEREPYVEEMVARKISGSASSRSMSDKSNLVNLTRDGSKRSLGSHSASHMSGSNLDGRSTISPGAFSMSRDGSMTSRSTYNSSRKITRSGRNLDGGSTSSPGEFSMSRDGSTTSRSAYNSSPKITRSGRNPGGGSTSSPGAFSMSHDGSMTSRSSRNSFRKNVGKAIGHNAIKQEESSSGMESTGNSTFEEHLAVKMSGKRSDHGLDGTPMLSSPEATGNSTFEERLALKMSSKRSNSDVGGTPTIDDDSSSSSSSDEDSLNSSSDEDQAPKRSKNRPPRDKKKKTRSRETTRKQSKRRPRKNDTNSRDGLPRTSSQEDNNLGHPCATGRSSPGGASNGSPHTKLLKRGISGDLDVASRSSSHRSHRKSKT